LSIILTAETVHQTGAQMLVTREKLTGQKQPQLTLQKLGRNEKTTVTSMQPHWLLRSR
jgi:hypothetical protein